MEADITIVYSQDKAITAEILGKSLSIGKVYRYTPRIEYVETEGKGILEIWLWGIRYSEEEFPYVVMRLMEGPPDPCEWRESCGGYEG